MNRTGTPLDKIRLHAYLRRPDAQVTYAVRLIAYFHNTSFSVSPGVRILPERQQSGRKPEKLFDPDTLRVTNAHPNADVVNQRLEHWEGKILGAFRKLAGEGGLTWVTAAMMEAELFPPAEQEQKTRKADLGKLTFPAFYELWLGENEGILKDNYTHKFRSVANLVESFRPGMTLGDIDEDFVRDYRRHLLKKGSTDATIAKEYKILRIAAERLALRLPRPGYATVSKVPRRSTWRKRSCAA